jgi:transposase
MARFKPVQTGAMLLPVEFSAQITPGSFEHALCFLVDHELDLSSLRGRFRNDVQGASAYDPAVLLKIVLLAYSRGLVGSRRIEAACRQNVLFMAVSGDSQPHFTTLAAFVSELGDDAAKLFAQVLLVCDRQGLIGRAMFAIDGVKLPSNASKAKSGTRADYQRQADKMERAAKQMLERHSEADAAPADTSQSRREARALERLHKEAKQLRDWLDAHPEDRRGPKGGLRQSNLTDNESAKMATGKGVIQGYTGVAAVDEKHQIIVDAQAHGTGAEQELLVPVARALKPHMGEGTQLSADAGYHSEAGLKALAEDGIDATIPDTGYRQRDERYQGQDLHQAKPDPLWDKRPRPETKPALYQPQDFRLAEDQSHAICPAGKRLHGNGRAQNGYIALKFRGAERDCGPCGQRQQCLRTPEKTKVRQVAYLQGKRDAPPSQTALMKAKIDSPEGRQMITRRFATVEPVFGNLRANKRLDRFTLRGRRKVDGQWKLYCLVHNIEKLAHSGLGR